MRTIQRVFELLAENIEGLKENPILLEVQTFMPLSIELVGPGPRGMPVVAMKHFYEQHGDICRDPEVEFEIDESGNWHPISYRQDSIGLKQEAVFLDPDSGMAMIRPKLIKDLNRFVKIWDRNLTEQGFLEAAKRMAEER